MSESSEQTGQDTIRYQWQLFLVAIMFYTRLPVPKDLPHSEQLLNESRAYFPLIGIVIGGISAISFLLLINVLPLVICVALSIIITILATGAFHEDGFADSCDGLGGGWSKEQVLTIMKDSRIGTYGCVGIFSLLGVKFLALWEIAQTDYLLFCMVIIFSHTTSRFLSSAVIEFYDYVQDIDKSKIKPIASHKLKSKDWRIGVGTVLFCFMLIVIQINLFIATTLSMAIAIFVSWQFSRYCQKRIGGYTGDTLGATQQLSELTIYLVILSFIY